MTRSAALPDQGPCCQLQPARKALTAKLPVLVDKDHQGLVCDGLCVAVVDNVVLTDVLTKHHLLAGRSKTKPAEE